MNSRARTTRHAERRAQQRCIPPLIHEWLERFGEQIHDGNGAVILYFNKRSRRKLEKHFGREPVKRFADKLHAYRVQDMSTGQIVTCGYRTKRLPH